MPIDTLVGTTLAGYALRGKVGEGGTATVFRAEHPQHGTVALKVLKDKLQEDPTAVARFLREDFDGAAHHIVLAHLSQNTNLPLLAKQAAVQALEERGPLFSARAEERVRVACYDGPSDWLNL